MSKKVALNIRLSIDEMVALAADSEQLEAFSEQILCEAMINDGRIKEEA